MIYRTGDKLPQIVKDPVTKVQLVMYAGASGDYNTIHFDEETARSRGLKGVIAHGMLSMAFLGQLTETAFGAGRTRKLEVHFRGMVNLGDVITLRGTVDDVREERGRSLAVCAIEAVNQEGSVVTSGQAEAWMG